jgi:uncharacterized Zn-binding protein involved in type VI secretion
MPLAARIGDAHRCQHTDPVPHGGGPVLGPGCRTVFIGGASAARAGDRAFCVGGAHDVIVTGEPTVLVGGKPAARLGDATDGGRVTSGCRTVIIGPHPLVAVLREAARDGVPLIEKPGSARPRDAEGDE